MRISEPIMIHILGCLERNPGLQAFHADELKTPKISQAEIIYHLTLLNEIGLVVAYNSEYDIGQMPPGVFCDSVLRLTWQGHEWLDKHRSDQ